jgi:hypothetical protein
MILEKVGGLSAGERMRFRNTTFKSEAQKTPHVYKTSIMGGRIFALRLSHAPKMLNAKDKKPGMAEDLVPVVSCLESFSQGKLCLRTNEYNPLRNISKM